MELQEPDPCDVKGAGQEKKIEAQSTEAQFGDGLACSSVDVPVMGAEQRGRVVPVELCVNSVERMST